MTSQRFFEVEVTILKFNEPTATNFPLEDEEEDVVVVSSSEVVEVVEEPPSLLLLQEMTVKLKRNMEKMMSICLTWFPIGELGKSKLYHDSGVFYKNVGRLWRCL